MELSDEELVKYTYEINNLSQYRACYLLRFCGRDDPESIYFTNRQLYIMFSKRFKEVGGMTPEISKQLGWEK